MTCSWKQFSRYLIAWVFSADGTNQMIYGIANAENQSCINAYVLREWAAEKPEGMIIYLN